MARKQKGRKRKDLNRLRAKDCCGCSIISWEKKKFDKFHELFFSDTLRGTDYEQHWLVPPVCNGGVECNKCGHFLCHDCVCAIQKAINTDHPDLEDSWLEATMHSSPEHVLQIPVGHCCIMKEKEATQPMTSMLPSVDPFLAGATHYYQYDLAIGSTPRKCVDVFALGAAGSNAPVTHAVFPIEIALVMANVKHHIPLLDLNGPTLTVHSTVLSSLPDGFNKPFFSIKVVTIDCTRNDAPPLGKINTCL
jgi:hypothetical protein